MPSGLEKVPESVASKIRKNIQELIDTKHDGVRRDFARKTKVSERSLEKWLRRKAPTTPHLPSLLRIAESEDVSLDWLILGRGRKRAPRALAASENATKLWESVVGLVRVPEGVARDEVHRLLPGEHELTSAIMAAANAYVARVCLVLGDYIDGKVPLSELLLRPEVRARVRNRPIQIELESPWTDSEPGED